MLNRPDFCAVCHRPFTPLKSVEGGFDVRTCSAGCARVLEARNADPTKAQARSEIATKVEVIDDALLAGFVSLRKKDGA